MNTCASCGSLSIRRIYDWPYSVNEGRSWTLGTGVMEEFFCGTCGNVTKRNLVVYNPELDA